MHVAKHGIIPNRNGEFSDPNYSQSFSYLFTRYLPLKKKVNCPRKRKCRKIGHNTPRNVFCMNNSKNIYMSY